MIVIGAEQGGVELKDALAAELHARGETVLETPFAGGHQQRPADKIADIEGEPGMRRETEAPR